MGIYKYITYNIGFFRKEKAVTEETELEMLEKMNAFLREEEQKLTDRLTKMKQCYLALIRQKKIKFQ